MVLKEKNPMFGNKGFHDYFSWLLKCSVFKFALYFLGQPGHLISLPYSAFKTLWENDHNHPGILNDLIQHLVTNCPEISQVNHPVTLVRWDDSLFTKRIIGPTPYSLYSWQNSKQVIKLLRNFNRLFFNVCSWYLSFLIGIK